jgi:ribosomal protein S18 acetylase RimI-like enzyme
VDVREIGPIGVDPEYQGHNIGRRIMQGAMEQSNIENRSLRLLVDSHNPVSFSLYLSLGFTVKQSVTCLIKTPKKTSIKIPTNIRFQFRN